MVATTQPHGGAQDGQLTLGDFEDDYPALNVGDHVVDVESDDSPMLVVGLTPDRAETYTIDDEGTTVADVNDDVEGEAVVEVVFPQSYHLEVEKKSYAYPRSRLRRTASIHG